MKILVFTIIFEECKGNINIDTGRIVLLGVYVSVLQQIVFSAILFCKV